MTEPEKESEKQQGISKEAWTAISAIAVALIGGIATIFTSDRGFASVKIWRSHNSYCSAKPPVKIIFWDKSKSCAQINLASLS